MTRPILTLKKVDVQTEQVEPIIKTDSPEESIGENLEGKKEEHAKEVDNKETKERKPVPPLVLKLCEQFPNLFNLELRRPLKVDIEEDILQALIEDVSVKTNDLYKALCYYLSSIAYMKGLGENDHRFDLNGEVCGLVSDVYSLETHCPKPKKPILKKTEPITPPFVVKICERFPKTFSLSDRKPLKVGISKEVVEIMRGEDAGPGVALRKAIQWYTSGIKYHLAIIEQTHRLDLEGNAVEEITPHQKDHAALAVKNIKHLLKKKTLAFKGKKKWHTKKKKTEQNEKDVLMDSCSINPQDLACLSGQ
jgi:sRNA-binding protein